MSDSTLVAFAADLVGTIFKTVKKAVKLRMRDRFAGFIALQVALSHVGHMIGAIDQYPVPGLVFRWATESDLPVPFLAAPEFSIDVDDHPTIVEPEVVYDLSNGKPGL